MKYFKGWYFKARSETQAIALIPATHTNGNADTFASIQIISDSGSWCAWFPKEQFSCNGNKLQITIDGNRFASKGLELNIRTDAVTASGRLEFGPLLPIRYDIMGPFKYVPFMECRHSVFSLTHTVNGILSINGEAYRFDDGTGYIEGDRGRSFPKSYAWTQCNFFDRSPGCIMLSVAEIPFLAMRFTGIIGVILWRGREYRIATYLGAKAVHIGDGELLISQGRFSITAKLIQKQGRPLFAPVGGGMERFIRESLSCTVYYSFKESGNLLFEFQTEIASFEYEYEM